MADNNRKERFLTKEETERLLAALKQSKSPVLPDLIEFLILTGARKSEASQARWEHIDMENGMWTVPILNFWNKVDIQTKCVARAVRSDYYTNMEKTPKIHDNTIKYFLSDRKNAISVIRALLPEKIQEHLDLEKIRYEKDTFIPKHLREYFSDLLTSVPTKCGTSESKVLFLLEHKSTFKRFTPLQFFKIYTGVLGFLSEKCKRRKR